MSAGDSLPLFLYLSPFLLLTLASIRGCVEGRREKRVRYARAIISRREKVPTSSLYFTRSAFGECFIMRDLLFSDAATSFALSRQAVR